jgi:hypothetical protein
MRTCNSLRNQNCSPASYDPSYVSNASETSASIYQTIRCNIPEDRHFLKLCSSERLLPRAKEIDLLFWFHFPSRMKETSPFIPSAALQPVSATKHCTAAGLYTFHINGAIVCRWATVVTRCLGIEVSSDIVHWHTQCHCTVQERRMSSLFHLNYHLYCPNCCLGREVHLSIR